MNTAIKRFFPVAMFMMVALCVPELALAAGADTGESSEFCSVLDDDVDSDCGHRSYHRECYAWIAHMLRRAGRFVLLSV